MRQDILEEAQRLRAERRPFALATVVAVKRPASGTPGARAIVLADGQIDGWVGGHCAQPTIVRQGLAALADGSPRLIVLSPDAQPDTTPSAGVVRVPMLCSSQGELQIFVEPFLPAVELIVLGASPVARTLARLGTLLDFEVTACDPEASMETFPEAHRLVQRLDMLAPVLSARSVVIVATMNTYDEDAARVALESDARYVGVVASERRFAALKQALREQGLSEELLSRLKRPQGLPGAALHPGEIAFSIMAELLEVRRQRVDIELGESLASATPRAEATDPICGMTVDIATAQYTSERDGQIYYFCCAGCQAQFDRQ